MRFQNGRGYLYYYYWTGGHEAYDDVEVLKVSIEKNTATAVHNIYFGDKKTDGRQGKVFLIKKKNKWLITKIDPGWKI